MTLTKPGFRLFGVHTGEVLRVRYNKGRVFVKAKILALGSVDKNGSEHPYVTPWAPVAFPGAGKTLGDYGVMFAPSKGDVCLIVFERGFPHLPYCIGFLPRIDETPPEFYNDDYTDKELEGAGDAKDRERPAEKYPEVNDAWIAKIAQQLYILLHGKTGHVVIDAPDSGDNDPKIELGEKASYRVVLETLAKDFFKHTHPGTGEPDNLSVDDWEDYVSKLTYTRKDPRSIEQGGSDEKKQEHPVSTEEATNNIGSFAKNVCKAITTADDFINDPVGSVIDGLEGAVSEYAGTMPKVDLESAKDSAVDAINKIGAEVGKQCTKGILGWIGDTLGPLIGNDASDAISNTVQSAVDSATDHGVGLAAKFVNDGYNTLKGWADDAGVTDALDSLDSDVLGAALDEGVSKVKDIANEAIGGVVSDVVNSVPGLKSGLDIAKGICSGNLAETAKGLFGMLIDGLNTATGGALTPFADGIKSVGAGLIDGAFQNDTEGGQ